MKKLLHQRDQEFYQNLKKILKKIYNYWQKLFQKNMEKQLKMLKVQ